MAVTGNATCSVVFSGDVSLSQTFPAAANGLSPGERIEVNLAMGDNTIPVPSGATRVLIVMPPLNLVLVKLKAVTGDQGLAINKLDPHSIGLDPSQTQIVLNAASIVNNVILYWV